MKMISTNCKIEWENVDVIERIDNTKLLIVTKDKKRHVFEFEDEEVRDLVYKTALEGISKNEG